MQCMKRLSSTAGALCLLYRGQAMLQVRTQRPITIIHAQSHAARLSISEAYMSSDG